MQKDALALYHKYHLDRADERLGMFECIAKHFDVERVLYPGSFVHATPSFVFPMVTYVDMEKRAKQFFATPELQQLIAQRKIYAQEAQVQFVHQDYATQLPERDESFDLLVSQYAGFISQHCKRYLKIGGWLLANNSHGDAGMAYLDENYELVGVVKRRSDKFPLQHKGPGAVLCAQQGSCRHKRIFGEHTERHRIPEVRICLRLCTNWIAVFRSIEQ